MKKTQTALLGFIFIALSSAATEISEIQKTSAQLQHLQQSPLKVTETFPNHVERSQKLVRGVPKSVEFLKAGDILFRHYTTTSSSVLIKNSKKLIAGNTPYIQVGGGGMRTIYQDLTGVFLTTPDFTARDVGVDGATVAIDLTLAADTPLLKIEPGIYLVPGAPRYPEWIIAKYENYLQNPNNAVSDSEKELFSRMTATGTKALDIQINLP